jgi:hypothetical protein
VTPIEILLVGLVLLDAYLVVGFHYVGALERLDGREANPFEWPVVLLIFGVVSLLLKPAIVGPIEDVDEAKVEAARRRSELIDHVGEILESEKWSEVGWP